MNKEDYEEQWIPFTKIYTILDKLEKRIATLEKVLASHAKCIGEMRGEQNE